MAIGTGMDMGMDTSARSSPELLHGAGRGLWGQALGMGSGCGYGASLVAGGWDGWGRRMWTPGHHDVYRQSGDQGQAGDMGVQAGMGVRGSQGWV